MRKQRSQGKRRGREATPPAPPSRCKRPQDPRGGGRPAPQEREKRRGQVAFTLHVAFAVRAAAHGAPSPARAGPGRRRRAPHERLQVKPSLGLLRALTPRTVPAPAQEAPPAAAAPQPPARGRLFIPSARLARCQARLPAQRRGHGGRGPNPSLTLRAGRGPKGHRSGNAPGASAASSSLRQGGMVGKGAGSLSHTSTRTHFISTRTSPC